MHEFLNQYKKWKLKNKSSVGRSRLSISAFNTFILLLFSPVKHIRNSSWITKVLLNKHGIPKFCFSWLFVFVFCLCVYFQTLRWSVCFICHCIPLYCSLGWQSLNHLQEDFIVFCLFCSSFLLCLLISKLNPFSVSDLSVIKQTQRHSEVST